MRIAIDGTPLSLTSGGLRRYTEELSEALRSEFPEDVCETISGTGRRLWWSARLSWTLAARRFDVFHGTNFEVPYLPLCPSVMTVHDISPWLNPEWHAGADRVRSRTPVLIGLGIPTVLLAPTQAVREQIVARFGVGRERIAVVPEAPKTLFCETNLRMEEGPYFLFVGTVEPRKNVPALLRAWRPLWERHQVHLVIAGRSREDAPRIEPEAGLFLAGEVTDHQLAGLYAGAIALVYPSRYEGFGLPVVEAMHCGTPVIASRDPAMVEVSGGAAIHADDHELTDAMERLLMDPDARRIRSELGRRRAAEFSWARTARMTREVYVEAIQRFAAGG
jgi:glycosyltransferase involved in cell wall biosynthesis